MLITKLYFIFKISEIWKQGQMSVENRKYYGTLERIIDRICLLIFIIAD